MASSSLTLRAQLEDLSRDTYERLEQARALHVRFGEETITDLLLLEIKRRKRDGSKLVQTSPLKEKTSGTDWEWWIGSSRIGWIRYAVQAKRADKFTGRYNSLTHKVGAIKQVDLLSQYAERKGAVPLYCFYNYPYTWVRSVHWQCCSQPFDPKQLACTIAPIGEVKTAISNIGCKNFKWMHQRPWVVPWRCLAYCPRIRRAQRLALQSSDRTYEHPLSTPGAKVVPTLPDDVATDLAREASLGPRVLHPYEAQDDELRPRRVLVLETSLEDEVFADPP